MQTPITAKVAQILHETENMTLPEKQNLFWVMLEKFGQENIFSYQNILISEKPSYFITFQSENYSRPNRKLGPWEGLEYYMAPDFDAPLDDLADYM